MIGYMLICILLAVVIISAMSPYFLKMSSQLKPKQTEVPGIFSFSPYTSQQISKLVGDKIINNLIATNGLRSVDEQRLPLRFQSQWCEDVLLYNLFKKKKTGFYIEIGAFDGVRLSNTYFFECIGWTGLLVEPQPVQFNKLIQNRPNSIAHNVCISTSKHDVVLNIVKEEAYETWSYITKEGESNATDGGFETVQVSVKCKTIDELMPTGIDKVDFISIDVEGMELDVIKTFSIGNYNPEIILLENPNKEINDYLLQFGYKPFMKTWINYLYTYNPDQFTKVDIYKDLGIEIKG